jgi:hypothetical protein
MASLILTALFAVTVLISAIYGLIRGLNKSVIRIMTLVVAAELTFVIAGPITTAIVENITIEGQTLGEMILGAVGQMEMAGPILESMPLLRQALLVAPAFVLSIPVFPVVFYVLKFITWIIFLFVQKPLRKLIFKDSCDKQVERQKPTGIRVAKRFGGMGVGIVTGVLIFAMIMTPVLGVFSSLPSSASIDQVLDTMVEQEMLSASDADMIRQIYGVTDCTLVKIYGAVGFTAAGRGYLASVSRIETDGRVTSLSAELNTLLTTVQSALSSNVLGVLLNSQDPNAIFQLLQDKEALDSLMGSLFQSELLQAAVPEIVGMAMAGVVEGLEMPANKEAVYHNMMDDVAEAVKSAQIDYAAIEAYEQAHGITYSFSRLSTKVSDAKKGMTEEEYNAEIAKLAELTVTISKIINSSLSGDNQAFTDNVAAEIVANVKTQVSQQGAAALENFNAADAVANIDISKVDTGDSNTQQLLDQIQDPQKFETDVATVETVTAAIQASVKEAFADESKAAETASTLASVVSDLAAAVASATDEEGNINAAKLDYDKVASAVTSLQNSPLKDLGSTMLDVVASGDLGGNEMLSDVIGAVKEGYENGEDIGGTIGAAGALIGLGSAMGSEGETNKDDMVTSLTGLINNLNEFTISLLPKILSNDTIVDMGIPAEHADAAYSVVETLLRELMNLKDAADYTGEVNSILSLYEIATGAEEFTEDDIGELVNYAIESDAIFNTLVSISTSNPFGIEIPDDGSREQLIEGIEKYYGESGKSQREYDIYMAVATLLGLDGEVKLK